MLNIENRVIMYDCFVVLFFGDAMTIESDLKLMGVSPDRLIQAFESGPSVMAISLAAVVPKSHPLNRIFVVKSLQEDGSFGDNDKEWFSVKKEPVDHFSIKANGCVSIYAFRFSVTRLSDKTSGILAFVNGHREAAFLSLQ